MIPKVSSPLLLSAHSGEKNPSNVYPQRQRSQHSCSPPTPTPLKLTLPHSHTPSRNPSLSHWPPSLHLYPHLYYLRPSSCNPVFRTAAQACTKCTDIPNEFMKSSGKECKEWGTFTHAYSGGSIVWQRAKNGLHHHVLLRLRD